MNQVNDHHLPFPFPGRTELSIRGQSREDVVVAELATSVIEKFQSASYRNGIDPDLPLALYFDNPSVQSYCLQNYLLPLELIQVEYGTGKVSGIALLAPNPYPGSMIQAFSGLSSVILAAPGFIAKHNIEVQHSFITLKSINYAKQA
jgi:uncharacterized membrane protein (UPF0127 family)